MHSATVTVNGADIYHEVRGEGPTILFIAGASGDAGHFEQVAAHLAEDFTVLTYDRRGRSRSPRPAGWESTSTEEQADDAAELLRTLELAPATVFGTSSGAMIALCLAIRHPDTVRAALLHEPPKIAVLPNRAEVIANLGAAVEAARATGGSSAAVEAFSRWLGGAAALERLDPLLRERFLAHGDVFFDLELGVVDAYRPGAAELDRLTAPVVVMMGSEAATGYHEGLSSSYRDALTELAGRLGASFRAVAGNHTPYDDRPAELAQDIRAAGRELSG